MLPLLVLQYTGWNYKIVVQKKTTLQIYFKTFIEKINSANLLMYESWHQFNVAAFSLNHRLDTDPELGALFFHKRRWELGEYSVDGGDQASFGVVGGHVGDDLDIWSNEVVQWVQVGGGGVPVREGYKVVALLLKPSLGLIWLVGRRRVLLPHPGSTTGRLIELCPQALNRPDLHFEGADNGPVDGMQRSVESMSCTAVHLRSRSLNIVSLSDMIEGTYRCWDLYKTGKLVDGLQQKKKTGFHLTEMESCRLF